MRLVFSTSVPTPCTCSWSTHIAAPTRGRRTPRSRCCVWPNTSVRTAGSRRLAADALIETVASARKAAEDHEVRGHARVRHLRRARRDATRPRCSPGSAQETGVDLQVLPGQDEARLTFLAVRRWFGWSAGRLLVLDIGGGSLEIAAGIDEEPEVALSLPLGAGRLARERLSADPPPRDRGRRPARVRASASSQSVDVGDWDRAAATSKTFRTLARLAGAAPSTAGFRAPRTLTLPGTAPGARLYPAHGLERLAEMDGVSAARAHQLLAGAVVAEATMRRLGVDAGRHLSLGPAGGRHSAPARRHRQRLTVAPRGSVRQTRATLTR